MLWPVSLVFRLLISVRKLLQKPAARPASHRVPVVVVGNISVGGTGKTPLLMSLAVQLQTLGYRPGIVSRGYGGQATTYPLAVNADTEVGECGDEALLMAQKTSCPVVIDPNREAAVQFLLANNEVDVVLSDDGLQHYKLHRDIEIIVVDGQRMFGNGLCLPAGPLREPVSRLAQADYLVINGEAAEQRSELAAAFSMTLKPRYLINLASADRRPFGGAPFNMGSTLQAVSAIGNPERFYQLLDKLPYPVKKISFPDHHLFIESDFDSSRIDEHQPVVMTEKDAVKCRPFARANFWYLEVGVELPEEFLTSFSERLSQLGATKKSQGVPG